MEVRKSNQKEERKGEKVIGGSEKKRERNRGRDRRLQVFLLYKFYSSKQNIS